MAPYLVYRMDCMSVEWKDTAVAARLEILRVVQKVVEWDSYSVGVSGVLSVVKLAVE